MARRQLWLLLVLLAASQAARGEPPPVTGKSVRTDLYGDPLPIGAVARAGAMRWRHASTIRAVAFSPNGEFLVSGAEEATLYFWEAATGKESRCIDGLPWSSAASWQVWSLAFSPDGKTLGVGRGGTTLLLEGGTGRLIRELDQEQVASLAYSPDGKLLATGGHKETIGLWDAATGAKVRQLKGYDSGVLSLAFSPDGKTLAAGDLKGWVLVWAVDSGKEVRRFQAHEKQVFSLAFSPDGKTLATAADDETVRTWEAGTGKAIHRLEGRTCDCQSVVFSPDGKILAGAGDGGFSPDGKILTGAGVTGGTVRLWNAASGTEIRQLQLEGRARDILYSLAFSPDGKTLAAGGAHCQVHRWQVATGKKLLLPEVHDNFVMSVAFSPDGRTLATGSLDGSLRMWEADTGRQVRRLPDEKKPAWSLAYSPDGKLLAGGLENETRLWDSATGKEVRRLQDRDKRDVRGAEVVAFSPDGKFIATCGYHKFISWEAANGKEVCQIPWKGISTRSISFSADGKYVAALSWTGTSVSLWGMPTGKEIRRWEVRDGVFALTCSPDGKTIATAGGRVRLWDATTGQEVVAMEPLGCMVQPAFSPDGRLLAGGSGVSDGVLYLWETSTGKLILRTAGHRGRIRSLAFAGDGRQLATAGDDGTALVWSLPELLGVKPAKAAGLKPAEVEQLWADLADQDPKRGQRAVWTLGGAPAQAVPLIRDKLSPPPAMPAERFRRLLADLDSDAFAVREKAEAELARSAEAVAESLRRALKDKPSAEVRRRIEHILEGLRALDEAPEQLRLSRSFQVLEQIATPEVTLVLKALGQGAPEARRTREARVVLERLERRRAARP